MLRLLVIVIELVAALGDARVDGVTLCVGLDAVVDDAAGGGGGASSLLADLRAFAPVQHRLYTEQHGSADEHCDEELDSIGDGHVIPALRHIVRCTSTTAASPEW